MNFRFKNRFLISILTVLLLFSLTVFTAGSSLRYAFAEETEEGTSEESIVETTCDSYVETEDSSWEETEEEIPVSEEEESGEIQDYPVDQEQPEDTSEEIQDPEETGEGSEEETGEETDAPEEDYEVGEYEENPDESEEDDFIVTDEEYSEEDPAEEEELTEEEEETDEEEEEETPQFAGEFGMADFETLPLLDLSTEELQVCAFCTGEDLGRVQMAVILAYIKAGNDSLDCEANDGAGILTSFGFTGNDYASWCRKNELKKENLKNQLSYIYSAIFRNAQSADTKDRTVSMFRKAGNVKLAASAFYCAARERNIKLPYSKEDITKTIIPAAQAYLELFSLGGEKREGTAGVAYYCQGNYANVPYDEGTVADSGCGITAFSMVASEITGLNFGPEVTASWAYPNGVNTVTNWGAYWWLAQRFGVEFLGQYAGDFDLAVEALREGNFVIASIRQDGFFTTSSAGHYILLTGIEEDGRICVNDPASYERSVYGPFEYEAVFGSCLQFWIFGR